MSPHSGTIEERTPSEIAALAAQYRLSTDPTGVPVRPEETARKLGVAIEYEGLQKRPRIINLDSFIDLRK